MFSDVKLRFIVTSDIHYKVETDIECSRFEKGMNMAYSYAAECEYKNIDAFFAVGDFANCGSADEMKKFRDSLDRVFAEDTKKVLMLASHEFKSDGGQTGAENRLAEIFNQQPDNYFDINGCSFICISTEDGCSIKDAKQKWLKNCLEDAAAKNRKAPIFVMQHPHLTDTVYGSINWGDDDIISILTDYPQVVDFSGHSHAPINDPRSIHQKYFTSLNTGSFSYFELDEFDFMYGTVPPDCKECAQFYIVEVDVNNAVRIIPVDILTESFFFDGYIIETPWEPDTFEYTDKRISEEKQPYFADDSKCDIAYVDGKLSLTFEQAKTDGYRVNTYSVVIRNNDNVILAQKKISSSYYIKNMPETVSLSFDFPHVSGKYKAEITANGFWAVKSDKFVVDFEI